jgi:4-hydroxy-3-methylbut-2-enyl diphosphate reductase
LHSQAKFGFFRKVLVVAGGFRPGCGAEGETMRVIRADVLGMCFGVRDSLAMIDEIGEPGAITIHGDLVHNQVVQLQLQARGFRMRSEESRRAALPETRAVLITAHGVSDRERARLVAAGKEIVDTTCPLVKRVHQAAVQLAEEGYFVLLIGRRGHVEVEGVIEDLEQFEVVESAAEVRAYPATRLGIVCQTTATERLVSSVRAAVATLNPSAQIKFVDTVCQPTKEHQRALEKLLEQVEAVVVVGGRTSNNTQQLVARCRELGKPALHVQSADELDLAWFKPFATVGLTAGTSTLHDTIDEVHRALVWIGTRDAGARGSEFSTSVELDPAKLLVNRSTPCTEQCRDAREAG